MKAKFIIGALLKTFCPLGLGLLVGNTIKLFGPDITWRVITMCILAIAGTVGLMLSIKS